MRVIVDTCVFSLALRRRSTGLQAPEVDLCARLARLVEQGTAALLGPVRQELLSGIRDPARFRSLRERLRALPHPVLTHSDYERAAESSNQCRAAGVSGSNVDFLLCGVSLERDWPILTTDPDFRFYARVLPLRLLG